MYISIIFKVLSLFYCCCFLCNVTATRRVARSLRYQTRDHRAAGLPENTGPQHLCCTPHCRAQTPGAFDIACAHGSLVVTKPDKKMNWTRHKAVGWWFNNTCICPYSKIFIWIGALCTFQIRMKSGMWLGSYRLKTQHWWPHYRKGGMDSERRALLSLMLCVYHLIGQTDLLHPCPSLEVSNELLKLVNILSMSQGRMM